MGKIIIYLIAMIILISLVNASLEYQNSDYPKLERDMEICSSGNYIYAVDFKDLRQAFYN